MPNEKYTRAKRAKNDEFYTRMKDIEAEVPMYGCAWAGAHVYSNCDAPWSNFVKYFEREKSNLGIVRYDHSAGDFRTTDNIKRLIEADIIVTNPPFSLFKEYFRMLIGREKRFLIIGNLGAVIYKDVFRSIKEKKVWLGTAPRVRVFDTPSGEREVAAYWFTNMRHDHLPQGVDTSPNRYTTEEYPRYDNYDAIEVRRTALIPDDYDGVMGVPRTYIEKHNPDQFDIVDIMAHGPMLHGRGKDARIMIRRKT